MERRDMLKSGMLLAALSAVGGSALAADHAHHHHAPANTKAADLQTAAADCVVKGQSCLAHCLELLGQGDKAMAECAKAVNQMLAICGALQNLAAQNAPHLPALAKLAQQVCLDCEKACRKHEKKHEECRACAESCAACAKKCKELAA